MTTRLGQPNTAVDEKAFAEFLEDETEAVISESTLSSDWSGLQALEVEQGNEAFVSPALQSHFIALCTAGYGIANLSYDALKDPPRSIVEPGTLCFLPAGQPAKFEMIGRARCTHVLIQPQVLTCVAERRNDGAFDPENLEGFAGRHHILLRETIEAIQSGAQWRSAVWADTMGLELATQLYDFVSVPAPHDETCVDLSGLQFGRVIDYIETHLTRDFTLEEMAQAVDVGIYRLVHGFAAETGSSIESYRMERRVGIAQNLLRTPSLNLSDAAVARQLGFTGVKELDGAFRSLLGVSVAHYRQGKLA
ncbi:MAG: AraC family transcriptional regulator [Pseudomonadota bacterium]